MSLLLARGADVVEAGTDSFTITESTAAVAVANSGTDTLVLVETGAGAITTTAAGDKFRGAVDPFVDPFEGTTLNTVLWSVSSGTPTVSGGKLRVQNAALRSRNVLDVVDYSLRDLSTLTFEWVAVAGFTEVLVGPTALDFDLDTGDLSYFGASDSVVVPYDAVAHRFVRWRYTSGTLVDVETSPDGATWSLLLADDWAVDSDNLLDTVVGFFSFDALGILDVYGVNAHLADHGAVAGAGSDTLAIDDSDSRVRCRHADTFNTFDTSFWSASQSSGYSIDAGRLKLDGVFAFASPGRVDLAPPVDMRVEVEIDDPDVSFTSWEVTDGYGDNAVSIDVETGVLVAYAGNGEEFPYDPVAHRWWRIVITATDAFAYTSPDGVDWTLRDSYPLAPHEPQFPLSQFEFAVLDGVAWFDNLQIADFIEPGDDDCEIVESGDAAIADAGTDTFTLSESGDGAIASSGTDSATVSESGDGTVTGAGTDTLALSESGDAAIADSGTDSLALTESGDGAIADAGTDTLTLAETGDGVLSGDGEDSLTVTESGDGAIADAGADTLAVTESGDAVVADDGTDSWALIESGDGAVAGSGTDSAGVTEIGDGAIAGAGTDTLGVDETGDGAISGDGTDDITIVESGDARVEEPGDVVESGTDTFATVATGDGAVAGDGTDTLTVVDSGTITPPTVQPATPRRPGVPDRLRPSRRATREFTIIVPSRVVVASSTRVRTSSAGPSTVVVRSGTRRAGVLRMIQSPELVHAAAVVPVLAGTRVVTGQHPRGASLVAIGTLPTRVARRDGPRAEDALLLLELL